MAEADPLRPPFVFVDVDTQRDFIEPDGSLYLPGCERIRPNLRRLTTLASDHGIPILATACAHLIDEEDPEPFPPHCLIGSPGQLRIAETSWAGQGEDMVIGPSDPVPLGDGDPPPAHLTLEKRRYDMFSHPGAKGLVLWYQDQMGDPTFVVYGVATDYCVACAVRGLLALGCRVALVADAVYAVDPAAEPETLSDLARLGAVLTMTEAVVQAVV